MSGDILRELYRRGDRSRGQPRFDQLGDRPLRTIIDRLGMKFGVVSDGEWQIQLDLAAERTEYVITEEINKAIIDAINICESPIEKHLFPWLLVQRHWFFDYPTVLLRYDRLKLPEHANGDAIGLLPQCRIGQFRVDFAFVWKRAGDIVKVVIECDGDAYHTNKEKDLERSRNLLRIANVIEIIRFTGGEIYRNPEKCAYMAAVSVHGACNSLRMGIK